MTILQKYEEMKKGCGMDFVPTGYDQRRIAVCKEKDLCPTCKASLKASLDCWREELEDKLKERKFLSKLDNIWAEQNNNFENPLLDRIHILVSNRFDKLLKEIEELNRILEKNGK